MLGKPEYPSLPELEERLQEIQRRIANLGDLLSPHYNQFFCIYLSKVVEELEHSIRYYETKQ